MLGLASGSRTVRLTAQRVSQQSVCAEYRNELFPAGPSLYVQIRTSTKRGGGNTKNGRDSAGRRLGVKKFGNEFVLPGQVIVRQRGTKFHPGQHIGIGRDHTLYALEPGYVKFYHHHLPFPHLATSQLLTPQARLVSSPGHIDDGSRPIVVPPPPRVFPPVKHPRGLRRYIGIAKERDEVLPRDERRLGRDRFFWGSRIKSILPDEPAMEGDQPAGLAAVEQARTVPS